MVDLNRMRHLIRRYPMACLRAEQARIRAQKLTRTISDAPRGGGSMNSTEEGLLYRVEALERKKAIWDELCRMREELAPIIDALENQAMERLAKTGDVERARKDMLEVQFARMRYLEGKSAREISYNLTYSESHVFRVIGNAERKIQSAE